MKLTNNQLAPAFRTQDVFGTEIDLQQLKGKKLYLAFERNAGCPVCNLRTHELLKQANTFKAANTVVVMVYESPVQTMKEYLDGNTYPFHFVADPQNKLYTQYGVQRSMLMLMRSMFNGLFSKIKLGSKLFKKPMKQDGNMDRIPAEFIIDERGKLKLAHYGKFVGDHLPVSDLMKLL